MGERSNLAARNEPRPKNSVECHVEMMGLSPGHATASSNVNPEAVARWQAGSLMAESSSAAQLERVVSFFLLNDFSSYGLDLS